MIDSFPDEKSLFLAALERSTPQQREAFLEEACAGNPDLLARVRELLKTHEETVGPLDLPPFDVDTALRDSLVERPGTRIGPYQLVEQIGEGGFGVVFLAEQEEPVRRQVALKVIKPGMDTRQVIARFEAERQALAMMDHPHIAKVYDAGSTDTGRPFFVMELVSGDPITQYCDRHHLTPRQRLELFIPVCQAVQHAHQKGIIHRDIKPSNVLVAEYDNRPVPKIIDFGVAKAIEQRLTEKSLFTEFGQVVGTPEYMSPEQARLNQLDIDTRTDVYSLGVLLYELLTGETPFDRARLRSAAFDELLRIIREEEPPRPSVRLNSSESLPSIAANRHIEPKQLSAIVHGELDWIVMKALEKDRTRRYDTASKFAEDVQHYLNDEPVEACPPSAGYRFRKFARRYRTPLLTTAVVLATVIVGLTLSTVLIAQAARQERQMATVAERERHRAESNFERALEAVDQMVQRVSEDLGNISNTHEIRTALLQDALNFYERLPEDEKLLEDSRTGPSLRQQTARAYMKVGKIAEHLGHFTQSEEARRQAIAVTEKLVKEFPGVREYREDLARSYSALGYRLLMSNRRQEDVEVQQRRIDVLEALANDFPTVPSYQRQLAYAYTDIGHAMCGLGRFEEAERHARQALLIRKRVATEYPNPHEDQNDLAHTFHWLGAVLAEENKLQDAEENYRKSLTLREQLLAQEPDSAAVLFSLAHLKRYLGDVLCREGKAQEAEPLYRQAIEAFTKRMGDFPNYYDWLHQLNLATDGLGMALMAMGRTQEAELELRRSLALAEQRLADFPGSGQTGDNGIGITRFNFGVLLFADGESQKAADQFRQAVEVFERQMVRDPTVVSERAALAYLLVACPAIQFRDAERAIQLVKSCLQHAPGKWTDWRTLGMAQYRTGDAAGAIRSLATAVQRSAGGDASIWFYLAMSHALAGHEDEAHQWYERAVRWMDDHQPQDVHLGLLRAEAEDVMGTQAVSESPDKELGKSQQAAEMKRQPKRVEAEN